MITPATAVPASSPVAVLYHTPRASLSGFGVELGAHGIHATPLHDAPDPELPAALLIGAGEVVPAGLPPHVVIIAQSTATDLPAERPLLFLPADSTAAFRTLRTALQMSASIITARRAESELARSRDELGELQRIGMALMTERDPDQLLVQILEQAIRLTHSDAGSLYLAETAEDGTERLRFKLSRNASLPQIPLVEFTLPISTASIAGYAAATGQTVSLDDAYRPPQGAPYTFNRSFDERFGYRTKSMLAVPMRDHRGAVVGVLQLLNRKRDHAARITGEDAAVQHVLPYGDDESRLLSALAGQAAVSIENSRLHEQIRHLFESFVKAAVTAIDQRDPTTAGHSIRVATLTIDIAGAVERGGTGRYRDVRFTREQLRELRYAAMLHDFGKVGVREEVLVKAKKLPPSLLERVEARFALIRRTLEAEYWRRRAEVAQQGSDPVRLQQLDEGYAQQIEELEKFHAAVRTANEPSLLPEASAAILIEIADRKFPTVSGEHAPYLSPEELKFLSIPKGTLDERERLEIESHVEQTYRFLRQIPWTEDLRNIAEIAYGHHEKLDGRGYPRGIDAQQIPVQTRIMTISDIFDALTASDRPYKPAVPTTRALDILKMEAKAGMLDSELVDLVVESGVYRTVLEKDWREL